MLFCYRSFVHTGQFRAGVVPNSDPRQIATPLIWYGLGLGVGEGERFQREGVVIICLGSKTGTTPLKFTQM